MPDKLNNLEELQESDSQTEEIKQPEDTQQPEEITEAVRISINEHRHKGITSSKLALKDFAIDGELAIGDNSLYDFNNERLGIGTTSPSQALHIYRPSAQILLEGSDSNSVTIKWKNTDGYFSATQDNQDWYWTNDDGDEVYRYDYSEQEHVFKDQLSLNSNKITDVTDPTAAQDAATKNYIDTEGFEKTVDSTTTDVTLQNDHTEQDLYSYTISGGELGTDGIYKMTLLIEDINISANTTHNYKLYYGSTVVASVDCNNSTASNTTFSGKVEGYLFGGGTTSSQEGFLYFSFGQSDIDVTRAINGYKGVATEDSTGDLTFKFAADLNDQNDLFKISQAFIEKIK